MAERRVITLTEYETTRLPPDELSEDLGTQIWNRYSDQVAVDFPSPKTAGQWGLTAQGWVGFLPLGHQLGISLRPKVPLANLFQMLEYAYRLKSFHLLESLTNCTSIEDFYERLASVLARRVLDRGRKGFYRTYLAESDSLPYLRGSLELGERLRQPWAIRLPCHFQEHTSDVEENQILAWTLLRIARSGSCTERVLPVVRRAYRTLQGVVTLQPFSGDRCVGRLYNRLNGDYEPLHALCRFFLEQSGPTHESGDRRMIPFIVNMGRLFELFVAEWLKVQLPSSLRIEAQEIVRFGGHGDLHFSIDLVLYDAISGEPIAVIDTKYKGAVGPSAADVSQVVSYAEAKGCQQAYLVYPAALARPFDESVGRIRVRTATYDLGADLDGAGRSLVEVLAGGGHGRQL